MRNMAGWKSIFSIPASMMGFVQEEDSASSDFIPGFDGTGV